MSSNRSENPFGFGLEGPDRRAAAIRAEEERVQLRHSRIEAQSSPYATAQERIHLWEELHGLALPRDHNHRLVNVIAKQTALTVQDIHDEQTRRHGPTVEATT